MRLFHKNKRLFFYIHNINVDVDEKRKVNQNAHFRNK